MKAPRRPAALVLLFDQPVPEVSAPVLLRAGARPAPTDRLRGPGARLLGPRRPGRPTTASSRPASPSSPARSTTPSWPRGTIRRGNSTSSPGGNEAADDGLALGISLVDLYLGEEPPANIVAVEQPLLAPIANSAGVYLERPILVVPDLITREADGTSRITRDQDLGPVLLRLRGGDLPPADVLRPCRPRDDRRGARRGVRRPGEDPDAESPADRGLPGRDSDFGRLGDIIEAVDRAIDAGSFFPVESPLNCSGCSYFRECRGWTGPGSSKSGELRGSPPRGGHPMLTEMLARAATSAHTPRPGRSAAP